MLAKGADALPRVTYQDASDAELVPVRTIEALCAKEGIAMGAAALGFSLRDPRVTSTIVGVSAPERLAQTRVWAETRLSEEIWDRLDALAYETEDPEAQRIYRPG